MGRGPARSFSLRHEDVRIAPPAPYVHAGKGSPIGLFAMSRLPQERCPFSIAGFRGQRRLSLSTEDWKWVRLSRPMTETRPAHQKALRKSGNRAPFRLYDLRHAYGTPAIEAGIDVFSVVKLMGHADLDTTQRTCICQKGTWKAHRRKSSTSGARQLTCKSLDNRGSLGR